MSHIRLTHTDPTALPADLGQEESPGALELMCRATAEQTRAVLELQGLFARNGGRLSPHFLTLEHQQREIRELEETRSFAVLNFSALTIWVGFGGQSATPGNGIPVPAMSWIQLPIETNLVEIAATESELTTHGEATVTFIRYRHLVNLAAGPLGNPPNAEVTVTTPSAAAVTEHSPRSHTVTNASTSVLAANPTRQGISVLNTGTTEVSLGLGATAVNGDDIVLQPASSWDGRIGNTLWRGAITAISPTAGSLAVVEV